MIEARRLVAAGLVGLAAACSRGSSAPSTIVEISPAPSSSTSEPVPEPPIVRRGPVTVIAGGDVELARATGQNILRDPSYDPFRRVATWLAAADVRFANLESQLSDQRGRTISPDNPLVFTGPPNGADVLARAGFTVVSTANNHAWDYGEKAMIETLDNLDRVGVAHAGTSRTPGGATTPAIVEAGGMRVAFLAFTAIWNQGALSQHVARDRVAGAERASMIAAVQAARRDANVVLVSIHGGEEYSDTPLAGARELYRAVIDAGADGVLGHHAHVMQGLEIYRGKPLIYGLGNLVMHMHSDHAWTGFGVLARMTFEDGRTPSTAVCPYRIDDAEPVPLESARLVTMALEHLRSISRPARVSFGEPDAGCFPVSTLAP
jgi:poly-gamma-glutamate synthesis protein (capsule biosynthesis protein)